MKRFVLLLVMLIGSGLLMEANAQSSKAERKAAKVAKKAEKFEKDSISSANLKAVVTSQAFVLEANTLFARTGQSFILNSTTNFVGFDGKNSTIQLAFDQLVGWNGVGGVTLDGTISKMEIADNKKGLGFTINISVKQKIGGMVTMFFNVSTDGSARVDMSGSFGEKLSYQGRIVPLSESSVYKGTSLF